MLDSFNCLSVKKLSANILVYMYEADIFSFDMKSIYFILHTPACKYH